MASAVAPAVPVSSRAEVALGAAQQDVAPVGRGGGDEPVGAQRERVDRRQVREPLRLPGAVAPREHAVGARHDGAGGRGEAVDLEPVEQHGELLARTRRRARRCARTGSTRRPGPGGAAAGAPERRDDAIVVEPRGVAERDVGGQRRERDPGARGEVVGARARPTRGRRSAASAPASRSREEAAIRRPAHRGGRADQSPRTAQSPPRPAPTRVPRASSWRSISSTQNTQVNVTPALKPPAESPLSSAPTRQPGFLACSALFLAFSSTSVDGLLELASRAP